MSTQLDELKSAAEKVAANAHAPYSKFSVGAAILSKNGKIYTGCNVENISSGLTVCAERNAIGKAVAEEGSSLEIMEVFVTNTNFEGKTVHCSPCGACRQVLAEFSKADTVVHYRGENGLITTNMNALLPDSFTF